MKAALVLLFCLVGMAAVMAEPAPEETDMHMFMYFPSVPAHMMHLASPLIHGPYPEHMIVPAAPTNGEEDEEEEENDMDAAEEDDVREKDLEDEEEDDDTTAEEDEEDDDEEDTPTKAPAAAAQPSAKVMEHAEAAMDDDKEYSGDGESTPPACPPQLHVHMYYPYQTPWTSYFDPQVSSGAVGGMQGTAQRTMQANGFGANPFGNYPYSHGAAPMPPMPAPQMSAPTFLQVGEERPTSERIRFHAHFLKQIPSDAAEESEYDLALLEEMIAKGFEGAATNDMELPPAGLLTPTNSMEEPCPPARPQLHLHLYDPTKPHFSLQGGKVPV